MPAGTWCTELIGIQSAVGGYNNSYSFSGDLTNNLVYANTNQGIVLDHAQANGSDLPQVINNTVYQEVGDAIRIQGSSQNVRLRNNILWVDAGYDLYVASDSQVGFNSDYNNLHTTGSGKLARWQLGDGSFRDFSTQVDWFYELGQDGHSQTADPLFVDRDGADNVLGFSSQTTGPVQYLDDGQAGFSTTGTWTSQGGGYGASSLKAATSGSPQATWTFSGLTPGSYYQLAATWPATASAYYARYSISDGNTVLTTTDISQTVAPNGFTDAGVPWNNLSLVYVTGSTLVVTLSSYYSGYPVVADAVRLRAVVGDHGLDDTGVESLTDGRCRGSAVVFSGRADLQRRSREPRAHGEYKSGGGQCRPDGADAVAEWRREA